MAVAVPDDLRNFLLNRHELQYDASKCEPGRIRLLSDTELAVGEVWVCVESGDDDPHVGENGYYTVPAVNLVAASNLPDSSYILLWLPDEKLYGTWDGEHYHLFAFPGVAWTDIVADPVRYIDTLWNGPWSEEHAEPFVPYPKYPFRPGRPR